MYNYPQGGVFLTMNKQKLSLLGFCKHKVRSKTLVLAIIFLFTICIAPFATASSTKKIRLSDYNYYPYSDVFNPDKNLFLFNPKKPQKGALASIKPFDNSKPVTDFSQFETTYNFTDKLFKLFPASDLKERWIIFSDLDIVKAKSKNFKTENNVERTLYAPYNNSFVTNKYPALIYPANPPQMGIDVAIRAGVYPWDLQIYAQKPMTRRDMALLLARTLQFFTPGYMLDIDDSYQQYFQLQGKDEILMPVPKGLDVIFAAEGFPWRADLRQYYYQPSQDGFVYDLEQRKLYEEYLDILPDKIKSDWKKIYNWHNYAGNIKDVYTIPPTDLKACVITWMIGLIDLKNGYFKPFDFVTKKEANEVLQRVQKLIQQRVEFLPFYQLNPAHLGKDRGYVTVYSKSEKTYKKALISDHPLINHDICGYNKILEKNNFCVMPSITDKLSYYWKFNVRSDIKPAKMPSYPLPKNKNVLLTSPYIPAYLYDIYLPIDGQVNHKGKQLFLYFKGKDLKNAVQNLYLFHRQFLDQILLPAGLKTMYSVDYRNIDKTLPVKTLTDGWYGLDTVRTYAKYSDIAKDLALRRPNNSGMSIFYSTKNTWLSVPVDEYMNYRCEQIKKYKIVSEAHVYYSSTRPDVGIIRIIYYPPTDKNWLKSKGLTTGKWYDIYFYYRESDRTYIPTYLYTLDLSKEYHEKCKKNSSVNSTLADVLKQQGVALDQ